VARAWKSAAGQTLSLDPIASQSLNLETSATRLARDLRVYYITNILHIIMIYYVRFLQKHNSA
jgi:hypothetical protein